MEKKKNLFLIISIQSILFISVFLVFLFFLPKIIDYGQRYFYGVKKGVYLENHLVERLHRQEVEEILLLLAKSRVSFPKDAYLEKKDGRIVDEIPGRILALEETLEAIFQAPPETTVFLIYQEIPSYITRDLLKSLSQVISSFTTIAGGGNGRVKNIILSTQALNNTLLLPGEILSFNETVGPPVPERGYALAPIIVGGEVVPGYGGGICQTATTLYNAALKANLEIVERHRHTLPIDYVPRGMDATIAYDSLDLKVKNNRSYPIIIKGWASYQVSFSILGPRED